MSAPGGAPLKPTKADPAQAERLHRFAHDLKNRLGGMSAALRMLDELPAGPERDEVKGFAERAYFKALFDLENVLDDLGVERGPTASSPVPVATAELLERICGELAFRFERKRQQVVTDIPEGHGFSGDPDLLHQVITTLLSNASKFSPLDATIRVTASGNGLSVIDEGVGLSAEDLPQVFKAYAWLSSQSTAGEEQGRGSLARASRAMRAMGGSLTAASSGAGTGATFSLHLPGKP
jgi:signal transduction histidine kinase